MVSSIRFALLLFFGLFFSAATWAALAVSPLKINFVVGQRGYRDISLQNSGKKGLYVEVTPVRIIRAGMPTQMKLKDDQTDPYKFGIAVSRLYTYVPAGGRSMIRIVPLLAQLTHDAVYGVQIVPLPGKPKPEPKRVKVVVTKMRVLVGYKLLVFIRPDNARPRLVASRKGKHLILVNQGNTNVLLYDGRQCDAYQQNCITLPSKRLYANNRWLLALKYTTQVSFVERLDQHRRVVHF